MGVSARCKAAGTRDQRRSPKPQVGLEARGFEPTESDHVAGPLKAPQYKVSAPIASCRINGSGGARITAFCLPLLLRAQSERRINSRRFCPRSTNAHRAMRDAFAG
jgi:hypothetical protein